MTPIKEGDEVRVVTLAVRPHDMPAGGWIGEVVHVTPKRVRIRYGGGIENIFDRQSQRLLRRNDVVPLRFRTLEQVEALAEKEG